MLLFIYYLFSSLNFVLGLAMQLRKYIWIAWVGEWMKCMSTLIDKFVLELTYLFTQIILSFLLEKKWKYLTLTGSFRT